MFGSYFHYRITIEYLNRFRRTSADRFKKRQSAATSTNIQFAIFNLKFSARGSVDLDSVRNS